MTCSRPNRRLVISVPSFSGRTRPPRRTRVRGVAAFRTCIYTTAMSCQINPEPAAPFGPESDMAITQGPPTAASPYTRLSKKSQRCIERLLSHRAEVIDLANVPYSKRAAVLILLYEKDDQLRVLLTRRALTLRTHPGQTALPGGKMDETDRDIVETAYREAFEEVGLPMNHPDVHTLCVLRPFVAWTRLLVTPVVAVLTDLGPLDNLAPAEGEVDVIFDHPFEALLDPQLSASEPLVPLNSELWPSDAEYYNYTDSEWTWLGTSTYRMHRFRSSASAIKGLTAEILIMAAVIAYDRSPSYTRYAPGQLTTFGDIVRSIDPSAFTELRKSGIAIEANAHRVVIGRV